MNRVLLVESAIRRNSGLLSGVLVEGTRVGVVEGPELVAVDQVGRVAALRVRVGRGEVLFVSLGDKDYS